MRKTSEVPKISIVVPCFNAEEFISQTLDSIISQDYDNLEVIIEDGASTDKTVEIIKRYAKKYKYIKWESKADKGQLDAINKGLKKATGEVLTFINADDVYKKEALKTVSQLFIKNENLMWAAGKGDVIDENNYKIARAVTNYKNLLLLVNSSSLLLTVNYLMQPSVFISRNAYHKHGPFTGNNRYVLEYELWLKLGKVEMPKIINSYLSSFRLHKKSFSTNQSKNILNDDMKIARDFTDNKLILVLHALHNRARLLFIK